MVGTVLSRRIVAQRRNRRQPVTRELRIYFEGDKRLRPGFTTFFQAVLEAARAQRWRVNFVATGGKPVEDYQTALKSDPDAYNILLMDSEGPYAETLFQDRCERHGLSRAHVNNVFWMVQLMESWFLADVDALREYFGQEFKMRVIRRNSNVEQISKLDVLSSLKAATRKCSKGEYHKTSHAPDLLSAIDPERVKTASPRCRQMFDSILQKLQSV